MGLLGTGRVAEGVPRSWGQDAALGAVSQESTEVCRKEQSPFHRCWGCLRSTAVEKQGGRQRWGELDPSQRKHI